MSAAIASISFVVRTRRITRWPSLFHGRHACDQVKLVHHSRGRNQLRDEAQRNGNINWDEHHERLLAYLRESLIRSGLFTEEILAELAMDLDRLADFEHPITNDAPFDRITYRVVDWCRAQPEPVRHEHDLHLQR
ncbi:hypothetical protein ACNF49_01830 [Actinomadura sp. ATCC 39365]